MKLRVITSSILFAVLFFGACKKDDEKFNFFTIEDDIHFGKQVDSTILADPTEYPILDPVKNKVAYDYVNGIKEKILATGKIKYTNEFEWKITLIHKDVLNAFATPGGYLYFYTGLLKFCDNEAEFAGVLAHEMAHSDRRHSTVNMTKTYGYGTILNILLGQNNEQLSGIVTGLISLSFSRDQEYEADKKAVEYITAVGYKGNEFANFFIKMDSMKQGGFTPEFLSTHPSDEERIQKINEEWTAKGLSGELSIIGNYDSLKVRFP